MNFNVSNNMYNTGYYNNNYNSNYKQQSISIHQDNQISTISENVNYSQNKENNNMQIDTKSIRKKLTIKLPEQIIQEKLDDVLNGLSHFSIGSDTDMQD